MTGISVVIPVYRAEKHLIELYRRLCVTLEKITEDFEIILVEDCGGDPSWLRIQELASQDSRVKGIKLTKNFGQHAATICGISKTSGQWIITMDNDLEQQPEDIFRLLAKGKEGYDLVYGIYNQRSHSVWRNVTSDIARKLFNLAIPSLNHEYTSFRVIRRDIAMAIINFDSPYPFVDGYLSWVTNNYSTVDVLHCERKYDGSTYNLTKLITHTMNIFITFSDLPLKIAAWTGLGAFLTGVLLLFTILIQKFIGGITVSGYASIMVAILLFGGLQMLILGIFGEYLGRINFKTSKKPLFLIAQEIQNKAEID
jgi:polyisoprenyl-phosphate glycosyltransferase